MTVLRWKLLKSSFDEARSLTNLLDAVAISVLGLFVALDSSIGLFGGASGLVVGIPITGSGVFAFLFFKVSYSGIILLTEIADDTRLQLLALAGEEYD